MPTVDEGLLGEGDTSPVAERSTWRLDLGADAVPAGWVFVILVGIVVAAVLRSPHIFRYGRFWAEEGTLHFRYMIDHSGPDGLLYVQTRTGYINLIANVNTWLAEKVPLEYAPLVTVWLSFGVIVFLAWVALAWPSDLLPNAGSRIAAAVLLVFGTAAISEAWVNSINAQTYLALLTVLLLFVRVNDMSTTRYTIGVIALTVCGLSGLYAVALAPLFILVALRDRRVRQWGFAAALVVTGAIQMAIFLNARLSGKLADTKAAAPGAGDLFRGLAGWHLSALALPLTWVSPRVSNTRRGQTGPAVELGIFAAIVVIFLVVLLWKSSNRWVAGLLALSFLLTEALVQFGAHSIEAGGRYAVVPIGILILMLVHGAATSGRVLRVVAAVVATSVLLVGTQQFYTRDDSVLRCYDCPNWADEVAAWKAGTTVELKIWPYQKEWVLKLDPPQDDAAPADPREPNDVDPPGLDQVAIEAAPAETAA